MSLGRTSWKGGLGLARVGVIAGVASLAIGAEAKSARQGGTVGAAAAGVAATSGYKLLDRGEHPLARPEFEAGRLDAAKRISQVSVVLKLTPAQEADRDALLRDLQNSSSPSYHKWLTPEEYAARFGARPEDTARVSAWLASQGFEVHFTSRLASRVAFSGTVAQLEAAFKTEMHNYKVGGETHYAMAKAPSMPADLADIVLGLHNTHDFHARPTAEYAIKNAIKHAVPDAPCSGPYCNGHGPGLAPPDWANIYNVSPLYSPSTGVGGQALDGTGVSIAIVGIADVAQSDINAFRTAYGLPASTITKTLVPATGAATAGNQGPGAEAVLDIEWSGGVAKGATVNYVYVGADVPNVDVATYWAIEQNLAPIISESWGGCEMSFTPSEANVAQVYGAAASLLGISYLAASGDQGAASCLGFGSGGIYVNVPASYPGVTAVGGTQFATGSLTFSGTGTTQTAYPSSATSEQVWNEGNDPNGTQGLQGVGSGGGGISILFPRPSYQSALSACTPVGNLPGGASAANMRQVPDVSFAAAQTLPGYFIQCSISIAAQDCSATGGSPAILAIGGTSAATPAFAGVVAILNQATGGRLGNINPTLYQLAATTPAAFHDITSGTNEIKCTTKDDGCPAGGLYGYAAGAGYDCATGLGSMDVAAVVKAWAALIPTTTTLATTPTLTSESAKVALTAGVSAKSGPAVAGGTVTFAFESYASNGTPDLAWTIGTAPVSGGSATLSTPIPPGLVNPAAQYVDVIAEYGGDSTHLASVSTKARVNFSPVTLCVSPGVHSVDAGATLTYTASGGSGGVNWLIYNDTACQQDGGGCSSMDGGTITTTSTPSWVLIQALDSQGAETWAELTVGSPKTGTAPWDGDSGILPSPAVCTAPVVTPGTTTTTGGKSGCSCTTGPRSEAAPAGLFAGLLLGLGMFIRRRRAN